jgi:cyclopropane fatty-acyl-phospholipid synthase-like methyltransferase
MNYRSAVGPERVYDVRGALQFCTMIELGLRDTHTMLDIGCGSLRGGRLFIAYLRRGKYYGVEPNMELVRAGIENELGLDILKVKAPTFSDTSMFEFSKLGKEFDYLLAQSIFSHTTQDQVHLCIKEAERVMHDTSVFVANFKVGEEDYTGDSWHYPRTIRYTEKFFVDIALSNGLIYKQIKPYGSNGMWFTLKKGV